MFEFIFDWLRLEDKPEPTPRFPPAPRVSMETRTTPTPTTYEEAVQLVAHQISPETVSNPFFHFTGGMSIRNNLGLWDRESPLYLHMQERFGLGMADDTGALISEGADALVNGREYNPWPDVERFKRHWEAMGIDPKTMEQVGPRPENGVYTLRVERP